MKEHLNIAGSTVNKLQILIGLVGLLVGTLVYLIDRPPDQTYFIYNSSIDLSLYNILPNLFGPIGNSLPAFIHVFSFTLITAGLLSCQKRGYLIICLSWFIVDITFELGQKFNSLAVKIIPDWFTGVPFFEHTKNYFLRGTFDLLDLIAITIGAILAYFTLSVTMQKVKVI